MAAASLREKDDTCSTASSNLYDSCETESTSTLSVSLRGTETDALALAEWGSCRFTSEASGSRDASHDERRGSRSGRQDDRQMDRRREAEVLDWWAEWESFNGHGDDVETYPHAEPPMAWASVLVIDSDEDDGANAANTTSAIWAKYLDLRDGDLRSGRDASSLHTGGVDCSKPGKIIVSL